MARKQGRHAGNRDLPADGEAGVLDGPRKPKAHDILANAASLVSGERAVSHGTDKRRNHWNIAQLWNGYLAIRDEPARPLDAQDVAVMMALLKIARTQYGAVNQDDFLDG